MTVAGIELLPKNNTWTLATGQPGIMDFIEASRRGDLARVKALFEQDAGVVRTVDGDGWTALLFAAYRGHVEVAQYLHDHGADITHRGPDDETALHLASMSGHAAIARLVLKGRADKAAVNGGGFTALMLAAEGGYGAILRVLLEHGGSYIDAAEYEGGWTATHFACQQGSRAMLTQLLEAGADPTLRTTDGQTALDIAIEHQDEDCSYQECVKVLQDWKRA